jgi:hypothetical protein
MLRTSSKALAIAALTAALAIGCAEDSPSDGTGGAAGDGGTGGASGEGGTGGTAGTGGSAGAGGAAGEGGMGGSAGAGGTAGTGGMGGAAGEGGTAGTGGMGGAAGEGGMGGSAGAGGAAGEGGMGGSADPVVGSGSGTTDWQALPTTATGCTYDSVDTVCTGCTITGPSVPGGGQCGQFGTQVVGGCEVPGGVLNAQLAIDTTISVSVSSVADGDVTHDVTVLASNPALGTAAGLVTVDDATIFASVTTGTPGSLENGLNPALAGRLLGEFTLGGNVLLLDNDASTGLGVEIPTAVTAVAPTSSPDVAFDYETFSLTLTIQASGTPLIVDDAGCIFDLPGDPVVLPVE